jgi:potassium-transporting ATPase potassium-binding subunit
VRINLYVLLPLAVVVGLALVALGVPMTLGGSVTATTLEGGEQTIARGPVALQLAIKHLGTNGGGFFGVNALHPYENPNAWSNAVLIWAILVIPFALCVTFGRSCAKRGRAGRCSW